MSHEWMYDVNGGGDSENRAGMDFKTSCVGTIAPGCKHNSGKKASQSPSKPKPKPKRTVRGMCDSEVTMTSRRSPSGAQTMATAK